MTISTEQANAHPDEINVAHGHTVDGEGLLNNYAIEPEMYAEDGGTLSEAKDRVTVVDIFSSEEEAKTAVLGMEQKGLRSTQISIIAKDYQEHNNSTSWENIDGAGGLAAVLLDLGISEHATVQFEEAIAEGKFLVVAIGDDREASQAQHVLEKIGHAVDLSD